MRDLLLVFHRWLALVISILLILVAGTGAATVFEQRISETTIVRVTPGARRLSLDTLAARAIAATGGGAVSTVGFGRAADQAFGFEVDRDTVETDLMLDPYTGRVIGEASPPTALIRMASRLHQFHTSLLAGQTGRAVVSVVTLGALFLIITGLIIWWRDKLWRIHWSASWKRIAFDLHHALGVAAALVLLIVVGSGVWMGFPRQIDPLVLSLNRTPLPSGQPKQPRADSTVAELPLDSLVQIAQAQVPGAPVLLLMRRPKQPAMVALRYPEDRTPGGRSRVFIDRYRGTVLRAMNTRTAEPGTKLMNLQRSLHTGDILGGVTQVIWFFAALILASQAVTGVLMWWNARKARTSVKSAVRA